MLIEKYNAELFSPPCDPGTEYRVVRINVETDLTEILPYMNALEPKADFNEKNSTLVWRDNERKYVIRPNEIAVSMVIDNHHGERLAEEIVNRLNEVWERREEIEPDYTLRIRPQVIDIIRYLPRTNCGECGMPSCMAFAAKLAEGDCEIEDCKPLFGEEHASNRVKLEDMGL